MDMFDLLFMDESFSLSFAISSLYFPYFVE